MEKNLIFEELSISDEVLKIGNVLKTKIIEEINKEEGQYLYNANRANVLIKNTRIHLDESVFGIVDNIYAQVIFFTSKEDYTKSFYSHNFGGQTNLNDKTIFLTLFGIENEINEAFLTSVLNHELKHCLQESLYLSPDISKLYKKALFVMNKADFFGEHLVKIARLIYFFDKNEINANMESLYQELIGMNDIHLQSVPILNEYEKHKLMLSDLNDYLFDDLIVFQVQDFFGKSLKEIINYLKHRVEYFEIRKRKVIWKYKEYINRLKLEKYNFKRFVI